MLSKRLEYNLGRPNFYKYGSYNWYIKESYNNPPWSQVYQNSCSNRNIYTKKKDLYCSQLPCNNCGIRLHTRDTALEVSDEIMEISCISSESETSLLEESSSSNNNSNLADSESTLSDDEGQDTDASGIEVVDNNT